MRAALPLPDFSSARVLVAGDVMLDRYCYGETERVSPEAPIQVVNMRHSDELPGGAANVSTNLAALGVESHLIGLVGDDEDAELLEVLLSDRSVQHRLIRVPDSRTIVKSRIVSRNQQLLRLDYEDSFSQASPSSVETLFVDLLPKIDAVLLSDYAKGCLRRVGDLIRHARNAGKPVFVDPKSKDFSIYAGATMLTPNFNEFNVAAGETCDDDDAIVRVAQAMCESLDLEALLVTRGGQGMSLVAKDQLPVHLPAETHEVYDATGAGDTVISVMAASYVAGSPFAQCASLANKAAGIVVTKVGVSTVTLDELAHTTNNNADEAVCSEEQLLALVRQARRQGQSIVMTNGCFDLLHTGHIEYLKQAASKGDKLVVAVNDDASVMRLKGNDRPVKTLAERMALLSALEMVDWVVPFSDDTPIHLIQKICPEVLVKGGDYKPDEVVGSDAVISNGGEVVIVDYIEGYSSSSLIARIRDGR